MEIIFKDEKLQRQYDKDGYTIIPLLSNQQVEKLKDLYHALFDKNVPGLYTSHSHSAGNVNMQVHHEIEKIVSSSVEKFFHHYDYVVNHFVVKSNVNSTDFRLHQDWTIIEEDKHQAVQLWCPLEDTSEENGGMFVVKGSHHFFNNIRSGSLEIKFLERNPEIDKHLIALRVKKGEALAYKQALFHGSFPNRSSQPRLVAIAAIKSSDAKWLYFDKQQDYSKNKMLNIFEMNTELFLSQLPRLEKGNQPDAPLIGEMFNDRFETASINLENFSAHLNRKNFFHSLKKMFS